jgi:hypothetical protein
MFVSKTFHTTLLVACAAVLLGGCGETRVSNADIGADSDPTVEPLNSIVSSPLVVNYATTEDLALESDLIVRATVRDVADPFVVYPGEPPFEGNPEYFDPTVYTDTILEVSEVIEGVDQETVTVRQVGGTVGNLSAEMLGEPEFVIGDELLLFLRDYSDWGYGDDIYWVVGLYQGFWRVDAGGIVLPHSKRYGHHTLESLREELAGISRLE